MAGQETPGAPTPYQLNYPPAGPEPEKRRRSPWIIGGMGCLTTLALTCLLFASSCASFLTTCDANPAVLWKLKGVEAKAAAYWQAKYHEPLIIKSSDYARESYAGTDIGSYRLEDVIIRTAGGNIIVYRDRDGLIADNRQSAQIQPALTTYVNQLVSKRVGGADGLITMASLESDLWLQPDPTLPPGTEPQRPKDAKDPLFSLYGHGGDSTVEWTMFATRYDGDIEEFVKRASKTGELSMPLWDTIYVGIGPQGVPGRDIMDLPQKLGAGQEPPWKADVDALAKELDSTFAARPEIVVATSMSARDGQADTIATVGRYPYREAGDDPAPGIMMSYVPLDGEGLMIASNEAGLTLREGDVKLERLDDVDDGDLNDAMEELGDYPVTLSGPVWRVSFSSDVQKTMRGIEEKRGYGGIDLLVLATPAWAAEHGLPSDPEDSESREVPALEWMEAGSVGADGALDVSVETASYGLSRVSVNEFHPETVHLRASSDAMLLAVLTERPASD